MTQRNLPGQNYSLAYDGENHLTAVSGAATANYTYDGDGQRVIAIEDAAATVFIGNYFEWQAGNSTKYYYAGATRVALRQGANPPQFLLGDHLGSTTRTASAAGAPRGMQLYRPWGALCSWLARQPVSWIRPLTSLRPVEARCARGRIKRMGAARRSRTAPIPRA